MTFTMEPEEPNHEADKPLATFGTIPTMYSRETPGVLNGLMRTHGAMTKVTEALEAHKRHLLAEVDVVDNHCGTLMDLAQTQYKTLMDQAQAERTSKVEAVQASVDMVDRMLADLRGA